ncbi:MAG: antibiotic biosynthesis monooxygenase [Deltaproteobacteria bacterium]|nr:antibiotic biosynthesis monooxygenase [Deltaproteobacteria bacterium]
MLLIIAVIKMKALPEKCLELKQTPLALIEPTRNEKGCLSFDVLRDIEHENCFTLLHQWMSRESLDKYLCSDPFAVLKGTSSLLISPPQIMINTVSESLGLQCWWGRWMK